MTLATLFVLVSVDLAWDRVSDERRTRHAILTSKLADASKKRFLFVSHIRFEVPMSARCCKRSLQSDAIRIGQGTKKVGKLSQRKT